MKSILQYGQIVRNRNKGLTDNLAVFHAGVTAMKDGYNVRMFERITTGTGAVIIRKRKCGNADCRF